MEEQNLTAKKKKKWLLPTIITAIIIIAALVITLIYNLPANRCDRQLALAEKHMSELNYEAAVLAYKAAIEIDPKNVEAYYGAVEAYNLLNNTDDMIVMYEQSLAMISELDEQEKAASIEYVDKIYLTASSVYPDYTQMINSFNQYNIDESYIKASTQNYLNIANDLTDSNNYSEALDIYEEILKNDSNNYNIKNSILNCVKKYVESLKENNDYAGINQLKKYYPEYNDTIDYDDILKELEDVIKEVDENGYYYIPWEKTGLDDHVMNWQDQNLENAMRKITGIEEREIMLSDVYNYTSLNLSYDDVSNITALTELRNIKELNLCGDKISDLTILNKIGTLESIDISYNNITDITALTDLTELKTLKLSGNIIKDFSVLKGLTNLTGLEIEDFVECNAVEEYNIVAKKTDISFLSDLTQLKYLDLAMNNIEDISPLETLINLEYLDISCNSISDIHSLQYLTQLRTVILSDGSVTIGGVYEETNNITDISALVNCTNLECLYIGDSEISDLSPISDMKNLEELYLQLDNNINLNDIADITSLKILDLHGAQVTNISALSGLVNLEKLTLGARWYKWANNIQDISALANMQKLTYLDLSFTSVENIDILSNLTNLEYLNLYGINGEEHQIIYHGYDVVSFSYEWEYIERFNNLDFLIPLINLKQLYLGSNGLTDVTALSGLTQLEKLDLSYNELTNVDSLSDLKNLKYLNLSLNQISDYSPVEFVEDLRTY